MNEKLIKFLNEKIAEIEKEYSIKGIIFARLDRYFSSIYDVVRETADGEELDRRIHNIFKETVETFYGYTDEQIHAFYKIYFYKEIISCCKNIDRILIADKNLETFYIYKYSTIKKQVIIADMQYHTCIGRQFREYTKGSPQYRKALELRERIAEDEFM